MYEYPVTAGPGPALHNRLLQRAQARKLHARSHLRQFIVSTVQTVVFGLLLLLSKETKRDTEALRSLPNETDTQGVPGLEKKPIRPIFEPCHPRFGNPFEHRL